MSTLDEIRDAIVDAKITHEGVEVTEYAECFVAMSQDLDGTLPVGYAVEWGPCSARDKRVIQEAPPSVWESAVNGSLEL